MDSIDKCKTLEEITNRRLKRYKDQVADGDNYEGVLVGIYEKPTHFVYELLQNADDALATKVQFELCQDKLIFYHNGSRDFDLKDIISITGVGNSTKKDNKSVGKFGVGFKSVFAITDTPLIYNRAFNFRIEHLSIPFEIEPDDLCGYTTKFILPFNSTKNADNRGSLINKISEELNSLDCATIMFLRNINNIQINDNGEKAEISLNREELENYELVQDLADEKSYYLFKDKKTNISFSFCVENNRIQPLEDVYLYSFLPTRIRSELPFYVDAPFDLATTRESIEFDSKRNKEVLDEISSFFRAVLLKLRDEEYIDQDFLNDILPVNISMCSRSRVYSRLYDELKDILKETELLPTINNKYINASNGVLPLTKEMTVLSKYEKQWLNIDHSHSMIRSYLMNELEVEKISVLDFSKYLIEEDILKKKNADWLLRYYSLCANNCTRSSYSWEYSEADRLKKLPIIKTRSNKFVCAYNGDEPQVFRYSKGIPNSMLIHGLFTSKSLTDSQKEDIRSFLSMLDIKERSPRQYIESSLLSNWDDLSLSNRKRVFFEICDIYNSASSSDKYDITSLLKDYEIFPAIQDGRRIWANGSNLMRGTDEQKLVFKHSAFLQKNYWTNIVEKDKKGNETQKGTKDFCIALGVIETIPVATTDDYEYRYRNDVEDVVIRKYKVDKQHYPRWWYSKLNYINNFEKVVSELKTEAEAVALVKLLSQIPKEKTEDQLAGASQNGKRAYSWRTIPASYLRILNNEAWLLKNKKHVRTRDIKRDDFVNRFHLSGNEFFLEQIDFKKSFVDTASDDERRAIETFEGLDEEEKKELERYAQEIRKRKNKQLNTIEKEEGGPEKSIEEMFPLLSEKELDEEEFLPDDTILKRVNKGGVNKHLDAQAKVSNRNVVDEKIDEDKPDGIKKKIGDTAEKIIANILKDKYEDCDINWFGGNNEGYDIAISKDGEDIKFIEVKAIGDYTGRVNVTPSEWGYARSEGDKYEIYIVNAKTGKYSIIRNPYKQYMDGLIDIEISAIIY